MSKAQEVRKRLFEDFEFYAKHCVTIRTKDQRLIPLVLNKGQRKLLACCVEQLEQRGYIRLIILKGRQMGSSTFVEAFLYFWVSQRKAHRALVVAHDAEATKAIFTMTRRLHENCPEHVRPASRISSRTELTFGALDSGYRVATAGGDGIVRGDTVTAGHLSEVAWWTASSAKANHSGLMDAIPSGRNAKGTMVFEESTANGYNLFWEHCDAARKGESDFRFVFLPWFWDEGYAEPVPAHFERTPDEIELDEAIHAEFQEHLTDEQLQFRRLKIAEKGLDLFRQEYPCTADEAFLTSGRPVFHPDRVKDLLEKAKGVKPLRQMSLQGVVEDDVRRLEWEDDPRGELTIYRRHNPHGTYYVGADVGGGVRKDYSVAVVTDSRRRVVAVWRSDRTLPDAFGCVLAHLGAFYNDAQTIVERNNHGILTNYILEKGGDESEPYPNVYREIIYDKVTDTETEVVGFMTTERSKPLVIDKLRAHVRDCEVDITDVTTLEEMRQYVINDKGKMTAEEGHHDDCVIALALSNHINDGPMVLIVTPDEDYFTPE